MTMSQPDIQDPFLGRLCYDEELDSYDGEISVGGSPIGFHLNTDEDGEVTPALERARQVLSGFAQYGKGAKEYAVAQLLELKNESWLAEDEEPVTREQFEARMELEDLDFSADGEVTFYHRDGDLFWGHTIAIVMDAQDRFTDADIPG
jgi:hypothetical protein